jgi:uncharacterized membrane protein YkoI
MTRKPLIIIATTAALAAGGVVAVQAIGSGDDGDKQATGPGAQQAKAAALQLIPGGEVNAVERDGENGATWEVEVSKPDGSTVDVRLDANYQKVVIESDSEDAGESGDG